LFASAAPAAGAELRYNFLGSDCCPGHSVHDFEADGNPRSFLKDDRIRHPHVESAVAVDVILSL